MTELKTLKDISGLTFGEKIKYDNNLKAEAIKILKEIRKAKKLAREGDYSLMKKFWEEKRILIEDMDGELCDGEALLKWWINLTEEDLK